MATKTLEAQFGRMSVNDENSNSGDGTKLYKSKVCILYHAALLSSPSHVNL